MFFMESIETQVDNLFNLDLTNDTPVLEITSTSLSYNADFDTNFEDNAAYSIGMNKFIEEAATIESLNLIIDEGRNEHSIMFYTWRSISRTFPTISDDTPNKNQVYECCYKILKPKIELIFKAYEFSIKAKEAFVTEVTRLSHPELLKEGFSEGILFTLGNLLDMLSSFDDLRSAKTSVKNDLSFYKRVQSLMKQMTSDPQTTQLLANVSMFLSASNEATEYLKRALSTIEGSHIVICDIIAFNCEALDGKYYISPTERHQFIRGLLASLSLVAHDKHTQSVLEKKKVPLARIDKIFREVPSIPLLGDMQTNVIVILRRMSNLYEWSVLDPNYSSKISNTVFNTVSWADQFYGEHASILTEFIYFLTSYKTNKTAESLYKFTPSEAHALYQITVKALRNMSRWNCTLQETFLYKMGHPADRSTIPDLSEDIDSYALATKYNYTESEKSAISKIIFYIKTLYRVLKENETLLICACNTFIYNQLQELVHTSLKEVERKALKTKKMLFRTIITGVIEIASDEVVYKDDPKNKKGPQIYSVKSKPVAPLSSQLYMIKTMLQFLISKKDFRKELDASLIVPISNFITDCNFYKAMSDFPRTLKNCAIMENFFFKEFYLEISAGKHIQFPLEWSFIWIIVQHLLDSNESDSMEYVLYVMDLYNDAAQLVLDKYKQRYLFDETDAEAVLCVQQLSYFISEKIYAYTKSLACSSFIDKSMKNEILRRLAAADKSLTTEGTIPYQSAQRIINICKQRSFQYLGRSLDLNHLICQNLLINIKKSIDAAITLFESSKIESIIQLVTLLEVTEITHSTLSETFELPPFEEILNEINNSIGENLHRITAQIALLLISDVIPNYSYSIVTQRFIRSPVSFTEPLPDDPSPKIAVQHLFGTKNMTIAFNEYLSIYVEYLGSAHFDAIFNLVGYDGVKFLVDEIKKLISILSSTTLKQYVSVLLAGMPSKCTLPRTAYGFNGVLEYYNAHLEAILKYNDLRPGFLHHLREYGNCVITVYLLEQAIYRVEGASLYISAPFNGILVSPDIPEGPAAEERLFNVVNSIKHCMINSPFVLSHDQELEKIVDKASVLTQERLCCGLSIFDNFISCLADYLNDPIWKGPEPTNAVISLEECNEFHRLFSAVCYYCAHPSPETSTTNDLVYGHALHFAGLSIILALRQQHRFHALDFVTHAIYVADVEASGGLVTSVASTGTHKSGTIRTLRGVKENKTFDVGAESINKKILTSMRVQVSRRRYIYNLLLNSFSNRSTSTDEVIRCYCPPSYSS